MLVWHRCVRGQVIRSMGVDDGFRLGKFGFQGAGVRLVGLEVASAWSVYKASWTRH